MLGKLLKHEFRATGRTILPIYGALVILSVLANLSIRFFNVTDNTFLHILFAIIIILYFMGIAAACVMTAVVMISRFYRNLLGPQGYLMHTLPASVHTQVWSKLIASLAWFAATFLVVWLVIMLTGLIQSGTELGELLSEIPTGAELRKMLADAGVSAGDLILIGLEALAMAILTVLATCLHFYAAMTLGHIGAKNKVLMSIVIFIGISLVFNILDTSLGIVQIRYYDQYDTVMATVGNVLDYTRATLGQAMLVQLIQGGLLYLATVLGLKKGLNLA